MKVWEIGYLLTDGQSTGRATPNGGGERAKDEFKLCYINVLKLQTKKPDVEADVVIQAAV